MATTEKRGNSYLIRISVGYSTDGKQIRKNFTWSPEPGLSERQIEKALTKKIVFLEERAASGRLIDSKIKFATFSELWMKDYADKQLSVKTVDRYSALLSRINQAIGHIRLDRIQPHHLLEFYSNLSESDVRMDSVYLAKPALMEKISKDNKSIAQFSRDIGIAASTIKAAYSGKNITRKSAQAICDGLNEPLTFLFSNQTKNALSPKTIMHHHRLISSILNTAVQWQIIETNPAVRVKAPKVIRSEAEYLDEEDVTRLISALNDEPIQLKTLITLLLLTGMRRGEICGLQWDDIDMKNSVISIQRTIQYSPRIGKFQKEPKTRTSVRMIKVTDSTINMLKIFHQWQNEERLRLGDLWQAGYREHEKDKRISYESACWVFTTWNGMPLLPDSVTAKFSKFIKKNSLPNVSVKSLRHTSASLLIAEGVDIRAVSQRLGHAQTSTTMNIYAHALQSAQTKAAEALDSKIFSDNKPQTSHKQA